MDKEVKKLTPKEIITEINERLDKNRVCKRWEIEERDLKELIEKLPFDKADKKKMRIEANYRKGKIKGENEKLYITIIAREKKYLETERKKLNRVIKGQEDYWGVYTLREIEGVKKLIKELDSENILLQYRMKCRFKKEKASNYYGSVDLGEEVCILKIENETISINDLDIEQCIEEGKKCTYHIVLKDNDKLIEQLKRYKVLDYNKYEELDSMTIEEYYNATEVEYEGGVGRNHIEHMINYIELRKKRTLMYEPMAYKISYINNNIKFEMIELDNPEEIQSKNDRWLKDN